MPRTPILWKTLPIVLLAIGHLHSASAQTCAAPPAGLVAWFPGDGNALDLQGGDSGTRGGNVTFVPGKVGQAFRFEHGSEVYVVDAPGLDGNAAITIDAWINPTLANGGAIVFKGENFGSYAIFLQTDRRITLRISNPSGSPSVDAVSSIAQIPLGAYTHIAATYDGATMRIYINGVLDNSKMTSLGTLQDSAQPLIIGAIGFTGAIDELDIINRALSQSEIQAIVTADSAGKCKPPTNPPPPATSCTPAPQNLGAWFAGDGNLLDLQGGDSGTVFNAGNVTFGPGKVGAAMQFNGNQGVDVVDSPALEATTALTLDVWVKPELGNNSAVVFKGSGFGSYVLFVNGDNRITFRISNDPAVDSVASFTQVPLNAYTHIAATYDGTRMRLYINGNLEAVKTTAIGTLADSSSGLIIGYLGYRGAIDELDIFNRVLSLNEIQLLFAAGSFGKCKPPTNPPPTPTACVEPPPQMSAWYAGDGNFDDLMGGQSGTVLGSGVGFTAGKVDEAMHFNASGDVRVPDSPALEATTALTLDAWIKPDLSNSSTIVVKGSSFGSYALFLTGDGRLNFRIGNTSTADAVNSVTQIPLNTYTHIAATYDGTRMRVYINGNLEAVKTTAIGTLADTSTGLVIGTSYRGAIDELEIFPRVLSQEEIQLLVAADSFGKCKCPEITLSPSTLPNGTAGSAYTQTLTPSAGVSPFSFIVTQGTLPPGLMLNSSTGVLSGTPTTTGNAFDFSVTVTDANGCDDEQPFSVTVVCPEISLSPSSLPAATLGTSYNQTITAQGGVGSRTFALTSGSLPPGLSLASGGVISGTPTNSSASPFNFTITATDANGCSGSRGYMIAINCPAVTLSPTSLPPGMIGTPYNQTINAGGTPGPFTFAITSGALPAGLSLNGSNGQISGTPTTAGTSNFTMTATDAARGCSGSRGYTLTISAAAPPCARAGDLDPTFGGDGFVGTSFDDGQGGSAYAHALARQGDGKIIAAGYVVDPSIDSYFALARYNQDGWLDPTFDSDGRVVTSFGSQSGYETAYARAIAVQSDGKILAAGLAFASGDGVARDNPNLTPRSIGIARYHPDGSLDETFANDGRAHLFYGLASATAMVLQPDGKIVLAGGDGNQSFLVARVNPDGSPDSSFGTGGRVTVGFGSNTNAEALAIAIQPDGKLVVGGKLGGPDYPNSRFALARCDSSGVLDPSFGQGGVVTTDFGPNDNFASEQLEGLVIQSDGKIVAAGQATVENAQRFALARYNADGSLDSSFGSAGTITTALAGGASAYAVRLQTDNKIVAAGSCSGGSAITRYLANGILDPDFGTGGRIITDLVLRSTRALLLEPDGDIVAAGTTQTGSVQGFALGRFAAGTCPSVNGRIAFVTAAGGSAFHISTINPDGTNETSLTNPPGSDSKPSYSRDGSRIVFARYLTTSANPVDIYAMNSNGTNQIRLTTDTDSREPSLSGDGTKIAFVRGSDIWVMNSNGSNQTQLTNNPAGEGEPAFSVDGTKITFVRSGNIWVMNADGSTQTQITNDVPGDGSPSFSPDRTRIVFSRNTDIYVMNSDGTNPTQLTGSYSTSNQTPAFSPDGTKIVYSGARPNDLFRLHVMDADGSNPAAILTFPSQTVIYPSWGGTAATSLPLTITSAVSRKMHGTLGPFDITLPLTDAPGVECRSSGGNHTLVFTFTNGVISGSASVTTGVGSVSGSPIFSSNTMTLNLMGVADVQQIGVTLSNVTDGFGQVLPATVARMNMLIGDTTGNKTVNASDLGQTKSQSGTPVTSANFRQDVTANGTINTSDIGLVKSRSGASVP